MFDFKTVKIGLATLALILVSAQKIWDTDATYAPGAHDPNRPG